MARAFITLIWLAAVSAANLAHGEDKRFGIGFVLGDPTALSFKYNLSHEHSIDAQLSFGGADWILLYGDYHWRFPGIFNSNEKFIKELTPYLGAGPILVFASRRDHPKGNYFDRRSDSMALGLRLPFGIEWVWDRVPIGIGLEVAPGIVIAPATSGFLHGGVTFRYYF